MSRHFTSAGPSGETEYKGLGGKEWEGAQSHWPFPAPQHKHCSFADTAILGAGHENELSSFLSCRDLNCVCSSSPSQAVLGRQRIRLEF